MNKYSITVNTVFQLTSKTNQDNNKTFQQCCQQSLNDLLISHIDLIKT